MGKLLQFIKSYQNISWLLLLLVAIEMLAFLIPSLHFINGFASYTPLHTIFEMIAIIVSLMVFAIGWGIPAENRCRNCMLLAVVFLGVGFLDLIHTLSFPGMPAFITSNTHEKTIIFWLMARLLSAFGLLFIAWLPWHVVISNKGRWEMLIGMLFFLGFLSVVGFKYPYLIPSTFVVGEGMSDFKRNVEFFVITLHVIAAIKFFTLMKTNHVFDMAGLFFAVTVIVLSEIYFTQYTQFNDVFNLLGHVYKVIAYISIYQSILIVTIKNPYEQLRASQSLLQSVIDNIPLRVFWKDQNLKYLGCNTLFAKDAGEQMPIDIIGKSDEQLVWHDQSDLYNIDDMTVIHTMTAKLNYEEPQTTPEGNRIWLKTSKVPLIDINKKPVGILGVYEDITDKKKLEEKLYLTYSAIEHANNSYFWFDNQVRVTHANSYACKSLGYSLDELVGMYVWDFDALYKPSDRLQMWEAIKVEGVISLESLYKRKDGTTFPVQVTANYMASGDVEQVFCVVQDITKRKQTEETIWKQANLDALTGLPNRRKFQDQLEHEIEKWQRTQLPFTLLFLDLDNFKDVNDVLGHVKGDHLLIEAAKRLNLCVRKLDMVARFGGDEFTILLSELADTDIIGGILQHILEAISQPYNLDGDVAYVTVSIGVTCYPSDGTNIDELYANADQAMYAAKAKGRNGFSYFTPGMQEIAKTRMSLANDLRHALTDNQLWVAYQPITEIETGKIHKAEALVRWQHPKHGLISPDQFISIAEHTGMIVDIGEFVFRSAAQAVKKWQEAYGAKFQVSVNVSPVQFNDKSDKFESWSQQLKEFRLSGESIVVEITESLLLDASAVTLDKLIEFSEAGIQVALDDFGTGYSAMSYLQKFDIDYIKIDQSFVNKLSSKSKSKYQALALCEAMIVMAHKLGMQVIAEGVETTEQWELLKGINCDYAQGYLISKPVSHEEFEKLLKNKIEHN